MKIEENWKKENSFSLTAELNKINGPIIEIGGPTENGFPLAKWDKIKKNAYISNVKQGAPTFDSKGNFSHFYGKVDFQTDAQRLPFSSQSIGAIRADSLPPHILEKTIDEAQRVLVKNGILILQGLDSNDVLFITKQNFTLIQYKMKDNNPYYTVFRKNY